MIAQAQSFLFSLFPATIHPMVVHFTIAIIYLAGLAELIALFSKDKFFEKAGFILLGLGVLATLAAGVAGSISESYDNITPAVAQILAQHVRFGELTGVSILIAWVIRLVTRYRNGRRVAIVSILFTIAAVALVSYVGHLGGTMVYDHGLGINGPGLGRVRP